MVFRTEIAGPAEVSPVFPPRSQIGKVLYTIMGFRDFIMNVAAQLKSSLLNLPAGILIIFTVTSPHSQMCSSSRQHANNSTVFIAKTPILSITMSVESVANVDIMQGSSLPTKRKYQSMILQLLSLRQLHGKSIKMSQKVQFRLYST